MANAKKRFLNVLSRDKYLLAILAFVALGALVLLFKTRAATQPSPVAIEGESGSISAPASKCTDAAASQGACIQYGGGGNLSVLQNGATLTEKTSLTESLPANLLNSSVDFVNITLDSTDSGGHQGDTGDPEPSPGTYNWSYLQDRINQSSSVNAQVVLRAYAAPPWMLDSHSSDTKPPVAQAHWQDYANLVLAAVKKFPQIKYVAVWNEFDGYHVANGAWDYAGYTNFYNTVYDTVHAGAPGVKIGGPYAPFPPSSNSRFYSSLRGPWGAIDQRSLDAVSYWLAHKHGGDFLAIDGRTALPNVIPADPVNSTQMFAAVDNWIRQQTSMPIWWMEWYARSPDIGQAKWTAVTAYTQIQLAYSGANTQLLWDAEHKPDEITTPGLWERGTNNPTPLTPVFQALKTNFYNTRVNLTSPVSGVEVLSNVNHFIAVEVGGSSHSLTLLGQSAALSPYQIITH